MERLFLISLSFLACSISFGQAPNEATVSMKDYVDMQSQLNKELMLKLIEVNNDNINDNVVRANTAMEKRLDGMNEFRGTIEDSNKTFVTWEALIGIIVGVSGFVFGYANYSRNKQSDSTTSKSKNIMSGDTVEVKKNKEV